MSKNTYEVEEIILAMVDVAFKNQELERENYELETGSVCYFDEENESIKRKMFEVTLRSLFNDSSRENVLMDVIDSMYKPAER